MIDLSAVPEEPGCYLYHDAAGDIIYVGKAKNLKRRVSSYFQKHGHDAKTQRLVEQIASADFIVTENEVEALILENTLIKRHQPKYNIDLKDAKNYAYIHLSSGAFPRIGIARRAGRDGEYFGPFVSARERDYVLSVVKKAFGLRSCRRLPKRPCLRHHIGTCSAPCAGTVTEEEYAARVERARAVLRGQGKDLVAAMEAEMTERSKDLEFERALELRDEIAAIRHLAGRQRVERRRDHDEDIITYQEKDGNLYLLLFHVEMGTLTGKQEYVFEASDDAVEEFLVQYYGEHAPPKEVVLPTGVGEPLADYLADRRGAKVEVTVPQKGDKKKLLDLAEKNLEIAFFGDAQKVAALQKALHLPEPPNVIECFDISHLAGTAMVGSMVQFRGGRPDKRNYRRFRIRTVEGIDDFASIAEVVGRRYARIRNEGGEFPDLVIVDGGKGQLDAALDVLKRLGTRLPVIAIAKREEEIYVPGFPHPLPIRKDEKASLFVQEIRDEAHRFAITYNRLLRRKEMRG
jgi:excinuclease ABC subunit C